MGGDAVTENDGILATAAMLRALGKPWAEVAEAVGRAEDTVTHWPTRHPERWNQYLGAAIDRTLATHEQEALQVCRRLLRSDDGAVALRASGVVLRHCAHLRGERLKIGGGGRTESGGPLTIVVVEAQRPGGDGEDGDDSDPGGAP